MISIIICSRSKTISQGLKDSIANSIGCAHELVVIDNSESTYSIFEAYNLGIQQSSGTLWCFMHDDVQFNTKDWGLIAENLFTKEPQLGLLGVAGAKVKTKMPSAWWDCDPDDRVVYLKQHFTDSNSKLVDMGWEQSSIEEVVAIDGAFMLGRADKRISFNEQLKGFHNYDIQLSMEYLSLDYKIKVCRDILIDHFSTGKRDKDWCISTLHFDQLYKDQLPKMTSSFTRQKLKDLEFNNGVYFCQKLLLNGLKKEALNYWFRLFRFKPISKFHFKFLKSVLNKGS